MHTHAHTHTHTHTRNTNIYLVYYNISDEVWLGCGERQGAKVCVINCGEEKLKLDIPLREVSTYHNFLNQKTANYSVHKNSWVPFHKNSPSSVFVVLSFGVQLTWVGCLEMRCVL